MTVYWYKYLSHSTPVLHATVLTALSDCAMFERIGPHTSVVCIQYLIGISLLFSIF